MGRRLHVMLVNHAERLAHPSTHGPAGSRGPGFRTRGPGFRTRGPGFRTRGAVARGASLPAGAPDVRPARAAWRTLAALLLSVLAPLAALPAQGEETQPNVRLTIENDTIVMSINEATGLEIKEFIKLTERVTGKVITFTESELQAQNSKVNFVGTVRLQREEFFSFFQTMLYIQGFACVLRGGGGTEITEVVSMQGPKRTEIASSARYVPIEQLADFATQTGVQVLTTVRLQNINAQNAATALRPFFSQSAGQAGGLIPGNLGDPRSLLLQGFGPQVYAAWQILRLADVPPELPEQDTRIVRLEHATAEELLPLLEQILEDRNRSLTQAAQPAAGGTIAAGQNDEVKVYAQPSLNALVVSGTPTRIVEALDLIARLDVPIEAGTSDIQVVQLKNVLAEDLENTLRNFLREDLNATRQAQQGTAGATGQQRQPRQTVIVAFPESNALLVSATQSNFRQLRQMIDLLDVRQPQVLIEAALVELSTNDLDRLGVELGLLDLADGDFTRGFGFTNFGLSTFSDSDGDGLPDTRLPDFENPLQGLTGGVIGNQDFAIPVLVNALQTDDRSNILSLPSIVVNNNESALVKSEENRPTLTQTQGTATTQTGVGEPRRAGIELNISPSISTNDYLRLNIDLTVSRFVGQADPTTGGITISRQVRTQVTLPSGSTMVLGGIIEDAESESESGIPYLKDIPLLGALFRNRSTELRKTNLYFFVTPTILDEEDFLDLQEISDRKKLEAAQYIGNRRLKVVDPKWTGSTQLTLDDPRATVDDLDRFGGFEFPRYRRPDTPPELDGSRPTGPELGTGEIGGRRAVPITPADPEESR
ncbi:MAG: hypothetical protein IPM29_13080 [Planctomycetes bacterium]|nr:hypothetical protein [Planctomycetota bacterium]